MRKYMGYMFLVLPYVITMICFGSQYKDITIITYLLTMIIPMPVSGIITGMGYSKGLFVHKVNSMALLCTAIYFLFYVAVMIIMEKCGIYEILYRNSIHLFVDGFSVGSDFSANIFDTFLPCCICYCIHTFCIKYSYKIKGRKKR